MNLRSTPFLEAKVVISSMSAIVVSDSTSALISRQLMRALCAVRGIDMLLNAAVGSILRAVHVMQSRAIVNSLFSAIVSFYERCLVCGMIIDLFI